MNSSSDSVLPDQGRLIGIDFGLRRIGIAVSDPSQSIASAWDVYTRQSPESDQRFFNRLVQAEDPVGFVIGLPLHLSGDESEISMAAREFGDWLRKITGLPIVFYDERLSSAEADFYLAQADKTSRQQKKLRDKIAAQIILNSYLNRT